MRRNVYSLILTCACACRLQESLSAKPAGVATAPACLRCGKPCDFSVVSVLQHSARALTPTPDSVNRILYLERPAACKKVGIDDRKYTYLIYKVLI